MIDWNIIFLQNFVPAHAQVHGNEMADELAKEGAEYY